jgi:hypothetical protein
MNTSEDMKEQQEAASPSKKGKKTDVLFAANFPALPGL